MSKKFAEQIIDSMVDESGHCGERGLSAKQFDIISSWLEPHEWEEMGEWQGTYTTKYFSSRVWEGNLGRYHVKVQERWHFRVGYNVVEIELRDPEEYQAELDEEARLKAMRDFSGSEWLAEPKERIDLTLTLVSDYEYDGYSYSYYDSPTSHIYTFRDGKGNCIIWKTKNAIYCGDRYAEVGDTITMKATVKEHGEYKGTKQTVITRPKVSAIA